MNTQARRSPLAMLVLALLMEEPMHPYRMGQLIRSRGKDEVVNIRQRTSIYQTIERLLRDGLIETQERGSEEGRPERTVYGLTPLGRETARRWMRELLSTPDQEFPGFPAALSVLMLLNPEDVLAQLEVREALLSQRFAAEQSQLAEAERTIKPLFLLDNTYSQALLQAELSWVRGLIAQLHSGELSWNQDELRALARGHDPPEAN